MSLLFAGDFFYDYESVADDISSMASYISNIGCVSVINLEGAIVEDATHLIKKRGEHLAQNVSVIKVLKSLNTVGVSICNNHIFDYSVQGVISTVKLLETKNIRSCGVRVQENSSLEPMCIECDGYTYKVFSATDPFEESICSKNGGIGCITISELLSLKNITKTDKICNVAFLHTGFEYNTLPSIRTIKECRRLIDNGFDYVICSHPHLIQPYEIYKGRPIFYSLGNFYFSSFREEFQSKTIANKDRGFCNKGIAVIINGSSYKTIEILYDEKNKRSYFSDDVHIENLNVVFDRKYNQQYIANRNNHNPLLKGDIFDALKMIFLYFLYFVYGVYRKLFKRKIQ